MPQNSREKKLESFGRLLDIMDDLRAGCPWDKKQTLESLRYLTIEETYELSDAIIDGDLNEIKGELGDIMLHMVFYSKIASEKEAFDVADVLQAICDKLVHRHPHIYGDVKAETEEEVKQNWEQLKLKEGKKSVLQGVPKSLPAMVKANRIQEKARGVGFDWENKEQVWEKVQEELGELKEELNNGAIHDKVESEFGDVLFSMINYARFIGINPEDALEKTNRKFIHRFQYLEAKAKEKGLNLADMTLEEMDVFWEEAKQH
jgi:XTP/dITP diphosphohydrolase